MDRCTIDQILVGPFGVFSYLLCDPATGNAVVIDPGANAKAILDRIRERNARVMWIVCTHAHPDHVGATAELRALTGAPLAIHASEADLMRRWTRRVLVRILGGRMEKKVDRILQHGDRLEIGVHAMEVIHTPGHSPGSICLVVDGNLFSGDTLFIGGVGRTDLPGSSLRDMADSLKNRVMTLPPDTRVWPGHDYGLAPSSMLSDEIRQNPFLQPGFLG